MNVYIAKHRRAWCERASSHRDEFIYTLQWFEAGFEAGAGAGAGAGAQVVRCSLSRVLPNSYIFILTPRF